MDLGWIWDGWMDGWMWDGWLVDWVVGWLVGWMFVDSNDNGIVTLQWSGDVRCVG
jgi:hypothetical protein